MESSSKAIKKPVTLKNIRTGKVQTWPSQTSCAKSFGLESVTISNLVNGKQKTIGREWTLTDEKPSEKRNAKARYKIIDHKELSEFVKAANVLAEVQRKYNKTGVQELGRINNKVMADLLGVQEINEGYYDWDGRKDGHVGFENKNNDFLTPRNLDGHYQDCSYEVMNRFREGGLGCNTSFYGAAYPTHCVVYTINKEICDCIEKKSHGKRNSSVLTLEDCLIHGNGQIVAINFTPEETYRNVIEKYPSLKDLVRPENIRRAGDMRDIANLLTAEL